MESWGEITERIYSTLNNNGYKYLAEEMNAEYSAGGTAGEMFTILCVWLAKKRNSKNDAYKSIKEDADKLLNYAIELKYFTKDSLNRL